MARKPSYPEDAAVGTGAPGQPATDEKGPKEAGPVRTRHLVTGAAIGIGSAALVAALLYANRSRKGTQKDRPLGKESEI